MKNIFLTILITAVATAMCIYFITSRSCGKATPRNPKTQNFGQLHRANPYPTGQAMNDIDTFQKMIRILTGDTLVPGLPNGTAKGITGFTISGKDLICALGIDSSVQSSFEDVRVYLGFNCDSQQFKLFLVSVSSTRTPNCSRCGSDYFFDTVMAGNETYTCVNNTLGQGNFVLDLISPCPFTCDPNSQLFANLHPQKMSVCDCGPSKKK